MNRTLQSSFAAAALALGLGAAAGAAHAATYVYVQPPPVYESPAPLVQVRPRPVYVARPAYEDDDGWRYEHRRAWRHSCGAPGWDPQVRYMPGQAVWREGSLYVATALSASVWNVNSPPEWTPDYWVPARCR